MSGGFLNQQKGCIANERNLMSVISTRKQHRLKSKHLQQYV